jgi:hypothetical protein
VKIWKEKKTTTRKDVHHKLCAASVSNSCSISRSFSCFILCAATQKEHNTRNCNAIYIKKKPTKQNKQTNKETNKQTKENKEKSTQHS